MKKIRFLTICPKHLLGSPMVPNGQSNVPWEVKIKYLTMAWFQYGKTGFYTFERWTKEYLINLDMFWRFSDSEGPPKGPKGPPTAPNGQPSLPWQVKMKDFTMGWDILLEKTGCHFHGRWIEEYLMIRSFFWPFSGSKEPTRAPEGPQGLLMDDLVCHEKSR